MTSPELQDLANGATVITAIVALIALVGAFWQVMVARASQREATAAALYGNYLTLAVSHPLLASGTIRKTAGDEFDLEFERYEWFVSVMLQAFGQILIVTEGDPIWRTVISRQIHLHITYLASSGFVATDYEATLQELFPQKGGGGGRERKRNRKSTLTKSTDQRLPPF